jgi:hypothetical protein
LTLNKGEVGAVALWHSPKGGAGRGLCRMLTLVYLLYTKLAAKTISLLAWLCGI